MDSTAVACLAGGTIAAIAKAQKQHSAQGVPRQLSASFVLAFFCLGLNAVTKSKIGTFIAGLFLFSVIVSEGGWIVTYPIAVLDALYPANPSNSHK